jgi:hypothetical protein
VSSTDLSACANSGAVAFEDGFPAAAGHALVVSREHVTRLEDLDRASWAEVFGLVHEPVLRLSETDSVDGVNIRGQQRASRWSDDRSCARSRDSASLRGCSGPAWWGALGDPGERGLLERAVTDPPALGEKLLSLLEESQQSSTYKPALLLAVIDRVQDHLDEDLIPVRELAGRVIELYWPQTLPYQTTGRVLQQNNAGGQAAIITQIARVRDQHGTSARSLSEAVRRDPSWAALVTRVEEILAEWPVPRLQRPYDPFLFEFDWTWEDARRWSARRYRHSSRAISLFPGVGAALTSLGPLLRPFHHAVVDG